MGELGANAHGEILAAGRVPDCYLGLVTAADGMDEAVGLLVVAPGTLVAVWPVAPTGWRWPGIRPRTSSTSVPSTVSRSSSNSIRFF